jgi:murein DD-endopeptidase MepM/ murein hydrolase activator NlpD
MMKPNTHKVTLLIVASVVMCVGWLLPLKAAAQNQNRNFPKIQISPKVIANGGVLLVQITAGNRNSPFSDMQVDFDQTTYPVYRHPVKRDGTFFTLIGVPYHTKPGAKTLTLQYSGPHGGQIRQLAFDVVQGKYRTDVLKVDSRRVDLNQKDRQRANREHQEVKRIYASGHPQRLWQGPFQLPVENEISSQFGNRRIFNGKLKSFHNGLDFRSPPGTPIQATNSGRVRLAKNLFYSGNAVIIDHGTDIFTIYAHLSKIQTRAGQHIEKGRLIGLTGATGRVSGPHLHWGIKINGIAVNPLQFVDVLAGLTQKAH